MFILDIPKDRTLGLVEKFSIGNGCPVFLEYKFRQTRQRAVFSVTQLLERYRVNRNSTLIALKKILGHDEQYLLLTISGIGRGYVLEHPVKQAQGTVIVHLLRQPPAQIVRTGYLQHQRIPQTDNAAFGQLSVRSTHLIQLAINGISPLRLFLSESPDGSIAVFATVMEKSGRLPGCHRIDHILPRIAAACEQHLELSISTGTEYRA